MLAAPAAPPPWDLLLQQREQNDQQQGQQEQQGQQQPELQAEGQAMEVDAPPGGAPASSSSLQAQQLFVARTYAAMAAALGGSNGSNAGSGTASYDGSTQTATPDGHPGVEPVQQPLLVWRPKQQLRIAQPAGAALAQAPAAATELPATPVRAAGAAPSAAAPRSNNNSLCLVEAAVFPLKTGAPAEGAALCLVAGWEARRCRRPLQVLGARQLRRRQREQEQRRAALLESGGDPSELGAPWLNDSSDMVAEDEVQVIGWVLSEAPRGLPRRCGALAAMAAAAAWRLRSLQHCGAASSSGDILAFVRNPGSASLFPVRLQLIVEQGLT